MRAHRPCLRHSAAARTRPRSAKESSVPPPGILAAGLEMRILAEYVLQFFQVSLDINCALAFLVFPEALGYARAKNQLWGKYYIELERWKSKESTARRPEHFRIHHTIDFQRLIRASISASAFCLL